MNKINDEVVKALGLHLINERNRKIFEAGGIAMPHFKTWKDYKAFTEIMSSIDKPARDPFKALPIGDVVFDIPARYIKD